METAEVEIRIARSVLLALADQYEHGNTRWLRIKPESVEEYASFKEKYAALVAEGLLRTSPFGDYQFTDKGYLKYSARIRAERTLG
jgi:hypothetical protein